MNKSKIYTYLLILETHIQRPNDAIVHLVKQRLTRWLCKTFNLEKMHEKGISHRATERQN